MSLNAIDSSHPSLSTAALCSSMVKSPVSSRSSASSSSCGSTSTRNPPASEVPPDDGDRPLRDESQRAEHRAVPAETDQRVGLIAQLSLAHGLYVVGYARGVAVVHHQLFAVRPRPARELLDDRRRVAARMQDEPQSPSRLDRLHGRNRRRTGNGA